MSLHALYIALKKIIDMPGKFLILTDSLGSIRALNSHWSKKHYILLEILTMLEKISPDKVAMEWVPSHQGILGNEKADSVANLASNLDLVKSIPRSQYEMKISINNDTNTEWKKSWEALPRCLTKFKTNLEPTAYGEETRNVQVTMSRLRLGTTLLSHGHYFTGTEPEKCPGCELPAKLEHVLVECNDLEDKRRPITEYCQNQDLTVSMINILTPPFPAELIINFLKSSNVQKRI